MRKLLALASVIGSTFQHKISLQGAAPAQDYDLAPTTVRHSIKLLTNGELWSIRLVLSNVQLEVGVDWDGFQPSPLRDYWARLTYVSGTATNYGNTVDGSTWYKVAGSGSAAVEFGHENSAPTSSVSGTTKVEIASDSGGLNILANANYTTVATIDL